MSKLEYGIQFWPWNPAPELVKYATRAVMGYPFDCVWVCDAHQYDDPFTIMTAIASHVDTSVGTLVTNLWRHPLDLAQRFATIAKLAATGRSAWMGLGAAGGGPTMQLFKDKWIPAGVMREGVRLMHELFAGNAIHLGDYPRLTDMYRYDPMGITQLIFPQPVKVYVAAGGPRMYELAGRHGDGVIFSNLVAPTSFAAVKAGLVQQHLDRVESARRLSGDQSRPFKKIYNMPVSVSRDSNRAKQWAKRNASYALTGAYMRYPEVLQPLGIDPEEVAPVYQAYRQSEGLEGAAAAVSDDLFDRAGFVFAGTPDQVIERALDAKTRLKALGFDHISIGVPLGPDVPEALELITQEIMPLLAE